MNTPTPHQKDLEKLCFGIYPKKFRSYPAVPDSEERYLRFLESNRLIHLLPEYKHDYLNYFNTLLDGLKLLKKVIGEDFLLIKTVSSYPHVTSDIDVVVPSKKSVDSAKQSVDKQWRSSLPIDINHVISWTRTDEISAEFIWNNTQAATVGSLSVTVPNAALDTLIRIGHMPFELAEVRLGELMHIFKTSQSVDWDSLRTEAARNGWPATFDRIVATLNGLHRNLYGTPLVKEAASATLDGVAFPYRLPYLQLAAAVWEKKSWEKIWGARLILKDRLMGTNKKHPLIVLCGMDGTGKSTLAREVAGALQKRGMGVKLLHAHQYATAKKSFAVGDSQILTYRRLFSLLVPFAFLDNLLTYFTSYLPALRQSPLISDRYFYDKVVRLVYYGILPRPLRGPYLRLLPRPTAVFFLDAKPQTAYKRKKEYNIEEYTRFRAEYLAAARSLHAPVISTDRSLEATVADILEKLEPHL